MPIYSSTRDSRGTGTVRQASRAAHIASLSFTRAARWLCLPLKLSMGVHLPVEGWADARIKQSLEINISLIITKS